MQPPFQCAVLCPAVHEINGVDLADKYPPPSLQWLIDMTQEDFDEQMRQVDELTIDCGVGGRLFFPSRQGPAGWAHTAPGMVKRPMYEGPWPEPRR